MKQWKKTVGIVVAVLAIYVAATFLFGNTKECCLCNSPSYSAPCLIDLETGDILQLSIDGPTTSGPEGQTDVSTFSFIRFHTVTGTKQTAPKVIELKIPADDTVNTPALCIGCRQHLPQGYDGRYVITDMDSNALLPIIAGIEIIIRTHHISMMLNGENFTLMIE